MLFCPVLSEHRGQWEALILPDCRLPVLPCPAPTWPSSLLPPARGQSLAHSQETLDRPTFTPVTSHYIHIYAGITRAMDREREGGTETHWDKGNREWEMESKGGRMGIKGKIEKKTKYALVQGWRLQWKSIRIHNPSWKPPIFIQQARGWNMWLSACVN